MLSINISIYINTMINMINIILNMQTKYKIISIIPARSGSKGIINKNIIEYDG